MFHVKQCKLWKCRTIMSSSLGKNGPMNDAIKLRICTITGLHNQVEICKLRDDTFEVAYSERVKATAALKLKHKKTFPTYEEALEDATTYFIKEPL